VLIRRLIHRSSRVLATLLCVACVPLVTLVLVRWLFGAPLSAFRPILSDEIYYWHEALTFARAGLHGGYYTLDEVTNASGFTPFGPHGAGFVMLYGVVGKVLEWHRHSVVVLNLLVVAIGGWIWAVCAPVTTARLWVSALLLASFWQMVFWASTGMQESLHHAGAIAMAALFAAALARPPATRVIVAGCVALGLLSLVRPTWIILMPLWALVTTRQSGRARTIGAVAASLVAAAVMLMIFNRTAAPYAGGFSFVQVFSLSVGTRSIVENLLFNLGRTVTFSEYDDLEILHRIQYWGFLTGTIALVGLWWRRSPPSPQGSGEAVWRTGPIAHMAVAATAMLTILGMMLVLYSLTNWAEHRVLSAFLLFGALLTLAAPGRAPLWLVAALIVSNVATAGTFRRVFEAKRQEQFIWDRRGIFELQEALAGRVGYRPGETRWCNTLLTAKELPYLIAVPAGIGISVVREPDQMPHIPYSRYLLVDESTLGNFKHRPRVNRLSTLPYGTLYVNLDADCREGVTR
jgi:hypothetical protein